MKNILKEVFKVAVLGGVLLALQVVAFSEPTQTPPGGNVPAPVNVGSVSQTKTGGFTAASLGSLGSACLATDSGNVGVGTVSPSQKLDVIGYVRGATGLCIGGDCRTTWPPDGFSQVEYKTCEGYGVGINPESKCTASCSAGWTLIGGGCETVLAGCGEESCFFPFLARSSPNSAKTGWTCTASAYGNTGATVIGTAICVK